jgi:hypothetical protein
MPILQNKGTKDHPLSESSAPFPMRSGRSANRPSTGERETPDDRDSSRAGYSAPVNVR